MSRRFISQLGQRENVDETFLASQKQLRANRNGNLYLQLQLSDRTGSRMAMQWNASDKSRNILRQLNAPVALAPPSLISLFRRLMNSL